MNEYYATVKDQPSEPATPVKSGQKKKKDAPLSPKETDKEAHDSKKRRSEPDYRMDKKEQVMASSPDDGGSDQRATESSSAGASPIDDSGIQTSLREESTGPAVKEPAPTGQEKAVEVTKRNRADLKDKLDVVTDVDDEGISTSSSWTSRVAVATTPTTATGRPQSDRCGPLEVVQRGPELVPASDAPLRMAHNQAKTDPSKPLSHPHSPARQIPSNLPTSDGIPTAATTTTTQSAITPSGQLESGFCDQPETVVVLNSIGVPFRFPAGFTPNTPRTLPAPPAPADDPSPLVTCIPVGRHMESERSLTGDKMEAKEEAVPSSPAVGQHVTGPAVANLDSPASLPPLPPSLPVTQEPLETTVVAPEQQPIPLTTNPPTPSADVTSSLVAITSSPPPPPPPPPASTPAPASTPTPTAVAVTVPNEKKMEDGSVMTNRRPASSGAAGGVSEHRHSKILRQAEMFQNLMMTRGGRNDPPPKNTMTLERPKKVTIHSYKVSPPAPPPAPPPSSPASLAG